VLEVVGALTLCAAMVTCSALGAQQGRTVTVLQQPDGSVTVTEVPPWWGTALIGIGSSIASAVAAVFLYSRDPRRITRTVSSSSEG